MNLVLQTDSYKFSHWKQYPPGTQFVYSYLESRGGMFEQTLFFGLQYYLLHYLSGAVVTEEDVIEAREFVDRHIGPGIIAIGPASRASSTSKPLSGPNSARSPSADMRQKSFGCAWAGQAPGAS